MTIHAGFVIACDQNDCIMRYFHVGTQWQDAAREVAERGWVATVGFHRCPEHAAIHARRN